MTLRSYKLETESQTGPLEFCTLGEALAGVVERYRQISPCPFCGIPAGYVKTGRLIFVGCQNLNCAVRPYVELDPASGSTTAEAVSAWNTRTVLPF